MTRFTGKERDGETGLDYFGARYMAGATGRFMSPDKPFMDQRPKDPQSWNLYTYARNNTLKYVDLTGEAIQLLGTTQEEREKELEAIRASLGGSKAVGRLYINTERDKNGKETGRHFVAIQGSASDFAQSGDLEARLAEVVGSSRILQFGLSDTVSQREEGTPLGLVNNPVTGWLFTQSFDVGARYGGGVTSHPDVTTTGFIQTIVDPGDIRDRTAARVGVPAATLGEVVAHEVLGHGLGFVRGVFGATNNRLAVEAENAARRRGGLGRGQKNVH